MKHLNYIFISLFTLLVFTFCSDDKGNYNYTDVDVIVIDTIGIENRLGLYSLELGKNIELKPNVTYNRNLDKLEYYWIAYPSNYQQVQEGNALVYPKADTLSYSHQLDWVVDITPGLYVIQFVVVDPVDKQRSFFSFPAVNIPEAGVKSGLYVLSEYDGNTDIDLYGSARALIIGGNHFTPKYYSTNHGNEMIPGKPQFISYGRDYYYAFTEQTGKRLNTNSLLLMEDFNDMFYSAPTVYKPQNLIYTNNCEFLINNGRLHILYTNKTNDRKFSAAIAGNYKAGNFLAKMTKNTYSSVQNAINADQIIFDEESRAFKPYFPQSIAIGNFKATNPNALIDVNNMKKEIRATFEGNGGKTYNVMNINGVDSLYMLSFYNVVDDGDLSEGTASRISLAGCKDIGIAKYFASSNAGNAFFYATENAVYSFSYTSGQTKQVDIYQTAAGEEITSLYLLPSGGFPTSGAVLWIGVWNESQKEGSLVEFEIDPTSGAVTSYWSNMFAPDLGNPSVTKGFGKIKSMVIKM